MELGFKQKDLDSCKIQLKKHESLIQTNLKLKDIIVELLKNIKKENTKFKNDISLAIDKSEKKNEDSLTIDENIDIVGIRFILNVINIDNFTKEEKLIINHYFKEIKTHSKINIKNFSTYKDEIKSLLYFFYKNSNLLKEKRFINNYKNLVSLMDRYISILKYRYNDF